MNMLCSMGLCAAVHVYTYTSVCLQGGTFMHLCTGFSQRKHKEKEVKRGSHLLPKARKESFLPGYSRLMDSLCCSLPRAKLCSLGLGCATYCGGKEGQAGADGPPICLACIRELFTHHQ